MLQAGHGVQIPPRWRLQKFLSLLFFDYYLPLPVIRLLAASACRPGILVRRGVAAPGRGGALIAGRHLSRGEAWQGPAKALG